MGRNRFNEKEIEDYFDSETHGVLKLQVWQSPKYLESRAIAEQFIDSKKVEGINDSDFWILMNKTKTGKMAYTGLIISHNGCLKINAAATQKFKPSCMTREVSAYSNSLVFTYSDDETGIYEVGEVNQKNCKNEYPFAMAFKRCFDRVVLKICKLAFSGIYSDSEADEFKDPQNETITENTELKVENKPEIGKVIDKKETEMSLAEAMGRTTRKGKSYCELSPDELKFIINSDKAAPDSKKAAKLVLDDIDMQPITDDGDLTF